ncbi:MAG: dynamin family protein [Pseudonocardia sp.]
MTGPLAERLRALLAAATAAYAGTPEQETLRAMSRRLDDPLRVAIAGRVKAGKSTLLNALLGERLAATDAGECTRVVTWYTHGVASRAWAHPRGAPPRQLPFDVRDGQTELELGGLRAEDLDRLVVEVPSARLERLVLIDTPGVGSLSAEVSARTTAAMGASGTAAAAEGAPVADAVLYLMRHLHATDVSFLESFHDSQFAGVTPVNAIGVLSRADEVGAGRADAIDLAGRVAADYRRDPRVRGLVQTVLPVAGLLAQAAAGLRERDYAALSALAGAGAVGEALVLSADRFVAPVPDSPVELGVRHELLAAFGLSGVRLSLALIRGGLVADSGALARELRRRSGLDALRGALLTQFTERRDLLKAQAALGAVERVLAARSVPGSDRLRSQVESVLVGAHELTELRLLNDLRTGVVELAAPDLSEQAEALLGITGVDARSRLRLPADAPEEDLRPAVIAALRRWQRRGESPIADAATRRVAAVLRRTCEGLLTATAPSPTSTPARPTVNLR